MAPGSGPAPQGRKPKDRSGELLVAPFVLPSWSFLSWLVINCMHPFLVLSGALEATLRQWGNIHKLYRLYIFLRERHHFVLYVPNGKATHWHKVYSFIAVDQQTNKCCFKSFQQHHLPNHAWGSVWLYYGMHPFSDRPQTGQKKGALFYSRANHTHSVWVRCPGM